MRKNILVLDGEGEFGDSFTGDELTAEIKRLLVDYFEGEFVCCEEGIDCRFSDGRKFLISVKEIV